MTDTITALRRELDAARAKIHKLENPAPRRKGRRYTKHVRRYSIGETVKLNGRAYTISAEPQTGDMILVDPGGYQTLIESIA